MVMSARHSESVHVKDGRTSCRRSDRVVHNSIAYKYEEQEEAEQE
jgi:hypothetical protein